MKFLVCNSKLASKENKNLYFIVFISYSRRDHCDDVGVVIGGLLHETPRSVFFFIFIIRLNSHALTCTRIHVSGRFGYILKKNQPVASSTAAVKQENIVSK